MSYIIILLLFKIHYFYMIISLNDDLVGFLLIHNFFGWKNAKVII